MGRWLQGVKEKYPSWKTRAAGRDFGGDLTVFGRDASMFHVEHLGFVVFHVEHDDLNSRKASLRGR